MSDLHGFVDDAAVPDVAGPPVDHGFIEEPKERTYLHDHPLEAAAIAAGKGIDEGLGGLPHVIARLSGAAGGTATPEQAKVEDESVDQHPAVRTGASIAAAVGPALWGDVAGLGAGASTLIKGGEGLATAGLPTLAAKVGAGAAEHAIRGLISSAPQVIGEAADGDYKRAAETLAFSTAIPALLGAAAPVAGAAATGAKDAYVAALNNDAAPTIAAKLAKYGSKGAVIAGSHLIPVPGAGWAGLYAARNAGEKLADHVGLNAGPVLSGLARWGEEGFDAIGQALSDHSDMLARVPTALGSIAEADASPTKVTDREAGDVARQATQLLSNPQTMLQHTSELVSPLNTGAGSQAVTLQLQDRIHNAAQYMSDQAPRPMSPPGPFTKQSWQPDPQALQAYKRKVEVLNDPGIVIDRLLDGTLTSDHVDAMQHLWPQVYEDIQHAVQEAGASPNAPQLGYAQRQKLGTLLGSPLDRTSVPANAQQLQASFSGGSGPQDGTGKMAGPKGKVTKVKYDQLPSTLTGAQKASFGTDD